MNYKTQEDLARVIQEDRYDFLMRDMSLEDMQQIIHEVEAELVRMEIERIDRNKGE